MRKGLMVAILLLCLPGMSEAQDFIRYYPPELGVSEAPFPDLFTARSLQSYNKTALVAGAQTTYSTVTIPIGGFFSGLIHSAVYCADAAGDVVIRWDVIPWNCYNKAGVEACGAGGITGASLVTASSGGSFSTYSVSFGTGGANKVNMTLNAVCSLAETTLDLYWTFQILAQSPGVTISNP